MEFRQDASVFTADDEYVGHVDRVVLYPRTKDVTHIVVRKGLLFTEDKVVPIELIASATGDRVVLRKDADDPGALPDFEETHYVMLDEEESTRAKAPAGSPPPLYWYPRAGVPRGYPARFRRPQVVENTERNIPEGTVPLKEGARVISADGEHVGDIECVLTDPELDRATHFVISRGLLRKERKLIPPMWVVRVGEEEVHLGVGSSLLDTLPEYGDSWEEEIPSSPHFLGQELSGKTIISVTNGKIIAAVVDVLIDPHTRQVAALVTSKGNLSKHGQIEVIPDQEVQVWGQDVILISQPDVILKGEELPHLEKWLSVSDHIKGCDVVSVDGTHVGKLNDVIIDTQGQLIGYDLAQVSVEGPVAESKEIPAGLTHSLDPDALIVL